MILGQSAATAACLAIDENVPVQGVKYSKLQAQLTANQQDLGIAANSVKTGAISPDNADANRAGMAGFRTNSTAHIDQAAIGH